MKKQFLILVLILGFFIPVCHAVKAEKIIETISIGADTHINEAVQILETYTLKATNKKMLNLSSYNGKINIPISNLPWESALDLILLQNKLVERDHPGYISIEDIPSPVTDTVEAPIRKQHLPSPNWCASKPLPCLRIELT